jgi:hypothetical protein
MDLSQLPLELIISLTIGLLLCFAGFRVKRIAFALICFILGYWAVKTYLPNIAPEPFWQWILQIAAGAVLALVSASAERLAVGVTCAIAVFQIVMQQCGPATDWVLPSVAAVIGVVAGCIAVAMMKPAVIIFTAIYGANLVAVAIVGLLPTEVSTNFPPLSWILLGAFATGGIFYQFKSTKNLA